MHLLLFRRKKKKPVQNWRSRCKWAESNYIEIDIHKYINIFVYAIIVAFTIFADTFLDALGVVCIPMDT